MRGRHVTATLSRGCLCRGSLHGRSLTVDAYLDPLLQLKRVKMLFGQRVSSIVTCRSLPLPETRVLLEHVSIPQTI